MSTVILFFSIKELLVTLGLASLATGTTLAAAKLLEADLINRSAIPFYTALVKGALDSFGLPRHGITSVKEHIDNTGKFDLDLAISEDESPLKTLVDLSSGRMLGHLEADAGTTLCQAIPELIRPTPSS